MIADKLYESVYKDRSRPKFNRKEKRAARYYTGFLAVVIFLLIVIVIMSVSQVPLIPEVGVLLLLLIYFSLLPFFNRKFNKALASAVERKAPFDKIRIKEFLEVEKVNQPELIKTISEQCRIKSEQNKNKEIDVQSWFGIGIALVALCLTFIDVEPYRLELFLGISFFTVLMYTMINAFKHLLAGSRDEKTRRFEHLQELLLEISLQKHIKEQSEERAKVEHLGQTFFRYTGG